MPQSALEFTSMILFNPCTTLKVSITIRPVFLNVDPIDIFMLDHSSLWRIVLGIIGWSAATLASVHKWKYHSSASVLTVWNDFEHCQMSLRGDRWASLLHPLKQHCIRHILLIRELKFRKLLAQSSFLAKGQSQDFSLGLPVFKTLN